MELIARERDRLLQRAARVYGMSFTLVSLVCAAVPGVADPAALLWSLPFYLALLATQFRLGGAAGAALVVLSVLALALGAGVIVTLTSVGQPSGAIVSAVLPLAAGALASLSLVLTTSIARIIVLVVGFVAIEILTVALTSDLMPPLRTASACVLGWLLSTAVALWVRASIPQVARRIASIGRAHRAQRQASELEAQRRQSARLLHDTVLATLTLLAHSGVGVNAAALRQQAGDDARLLRQLRLSATGMPPASDSDDDPPAAGAVDEPVLGTTLESVKQRFGRMGLEVHWHGTGQMLLPSHVLDAFLLALAECLENVRRHSGVTTADVTITEDENMVRALVTDQGVGFNIADIDEAKLGFAESVVARLREVGGNARLFSAPGAGTTVALEVPR